MELEVRSRYSEAVGARVVYGRRRHLFWGLRMACANKNRADSRGASANRVSRIRAKASCANATVWRRVSFCSKMVLDRGLWPICLTSALQVAVRQHASKSSENLLRDPSLANAMKTRDRYPGHEGADLVEHLLTQSVFQEPGQHRPRSNPVSP
jgi:hypothetical protein